MNKQQKVVLLCTAVVIGLMVLFPPYVVKSYSHVVIKSGYGFIFDLPPYIIDVQDYIALMNTRGVYLMLFFAISAAICSISSVCFSSFSKSLLSEFI
jgi:hypothetical protein